MTTTPDEAGWNRTTRLLHWLTAALIGAQWLSGWIGHEMERSPARVDMMTFHKSLGLTLLCIVLLRLAWRARFPAPPPLAGSKPWQIRAASVSHGALYVLLVTVPVSGWIAASTYLVPWKFWWVVPLPRLLPVDRDWHERATSAHEALIAALLVLAAVHALAAFWHHFVRRDRVLLRMWRGGTP